MAFGLVMSDSVCSLKLAFPFMTLATVAACWLRCSWRVFGQSGNIPEARWPGHQVICIESKPSGDNIPVLRHIG
jgi:hypothetical protein